MNSLLRVDQKRILKLVATEEAFHSLQEAIKIVKLESEIVSVNNALGRTLGEGIVAQSDIPSINRSAVDGYAVRSNETRNASAEKPLKLKIRGELFPANTTSGFRLQKGYTAYLGCGAPVPEGADAVIRIEETKRHGEELEVCCPIEKNKNVILIGEDVKRGTTVLNEGHVLRPQDIGQLAALRIKKVKATRKPRVAIVSVGDELTELENDDPSKIINNYALIISALASESGASSEIIGIASDRVSEIVERITKALNVAEIIITIGGCSVGIKDFVPDAVNAIGKPGVIVHGIKISPGKVTGFGILKGKPIFMLPGHVASTVAGFHLFVAPLIRLYSGSNIRAPEIIATANQDVKANSGMQLFLKVKVKKSNGRFIAEPIHGGSSSVSALINANGFTILKEGVHVKKGDELLVTLFSEKELKQI